METAKVDIQKLQLLNDRINQTIDALNHVRASVHGLQSGPSFVPPMWQGLSGLSHSPVVGGGIPGGIGMQGLMSPWGQWGQSQYAQQALAQQIPVGISSLFGQSPWGPIGAQSPLGLQSQYGAQLAQQSPYATGYGLGHSPYDVYGAAGGYVDPLLLARVAQTFPFAHSPVPPRRY